MSASTVTSFPHTGQVTMRQTHRTPRREEPPCTEESARLALEAAMREREDVFRQLGDPVMVAKLKALIAQSGGAQ